MDPFLLKQKLEYKNVYSGYYQSGEKIIDGS